MYRRARSNLAGGRLGNKSLDELLRCIRSARCACQPNTIRDKTFKTLSTRGGLASSAWHHQRDGPVSSLGCLGHGHRAVCGGRLFRSCGRLEGHAFGLQFPSGHCLLEGGWLARHGTISVMGPPHRSDVWGMGTEQCAVVDFFEAVVLRGMLLVSDFLQSIVHSRGVG